ncbi:MAG: hypothetical protein J0M34_01005 [Alphaproteobacteria bacterium]|nr:hypothetical protein [Alphaproteobacteria bacterium]
MSSTTSLPPHKRQKLVRETTALARAYLAAGKTVNEAVAHTTEVHEALHQAIDPNGKFTHLFAVEIEKEWNKLLPLYPLPHAEATRCARNILTNRAAEEAAYVALLKSPDFTTQEVEQALANNTVMHQGNVMPEGKIKEIAGRLVQESDPHGPEGATHVAAGALGQRVMHEALAAAFTPNGTLAQALIGKLQPHLPNASPDTLLSIANGWLEDRYRPAKAVAEAMQFDGAAYQIAAKRADELQQAKITTPPAKQGFTDRIKAQAIAAKEIALDSL